jgi:hypothetical protein
MSPVGLPRGGGGGYVPGGKQALGSGGGHTSPGMGDGAGASTLRKRNTRTCAKSNGSQC